jgi:acyl-coenzyme A synthetase/AMP-(fatty) acid ligase
LSPLEAALHPALEEGHWHIPDHFNFTEDVIEVLAEDPKRRALMLIDPEGVIEPRTFHQLAEGATRWAAHLREHGVRPGDRVLVLVASKLSWIEVMLAGIKVGAATVPCPQTLSPAALDIRIASAGAGLIVAGRTSEVERVKTAARPTVLYVEDVQELPERHLGDEPSADTSTRDLAFILSTSGAAYGPHGVAHTHAAAFAPRAGGALARCPPG